MAVELALGAAAMLFVAAMIEGFWSAQPLPLGIKSLVAAILWIVVIAYLGARRERGSPQPERSASVASRGARAAGVGPTALIGAPLEARGRDLALEPRSVGAAIDLAILFYRRHAAKLLALSLLFGAAPVALAGFRATRGDGWLWAVLLFFFGSAFLGAAVVAGAGHHVFGEEFTLRNTLRHLGRRA